MNIHDLAKKFGVRENDMLENIDSEPCQTDISALEKIHESLDLKTAGLQAIKNDSYRLESEISGLKFEYFSILKENQVLALKLSGMIAQNNQLKLFSGAGKSQKYDEIIKLLRRYISTFRDK